MKALLITAIFSTFTSSAFALFDPQAKKGFDISCQNEKMEAAVRFDQSASETATVRITDFETESTSGDLSVVPMIKSGAQIFSGQNFKLAIVYGDGQMTGVYSSAQRSEKLIYQTIYHIMQNSEY